jgi:hypothetical protein
MGDSTRRDALARDISRRMLLCNFDELRLLDQLLIGIERDRERYGALDLTKSRDWDRDEAEALIDARICRAAATLVEHDERISRVTLDELPLPVMTELPGKGEAG